MKKLRKPWVLLLTLIAVGLLSAGCGLPPLIQSVSVWTPAAVAVAPASPTYTSVPPTAVPAAAAPTASPTTKPTSSPTASPIPTARVVRPTSAPVVLPSPTITASPTVDQHLMVITEQDIAKAVSGGAAGQSGATVEGLNVRFADGKIYVTAQRLGYGMLNVQNLNLVGRLVAQNGQLQLQVESISPGGLIAGMIPSMANQALAQYASQWYVEEVQTLDGRLELRIR